MICLLLCRKQSGLICGWLVLWLVVVSSVIGIFWKVLFRFFLLLWWYIQVLICDIYLIKKLLSGEFRNCGGDFGMMLILVIKGC